MVPEKIAAWKFSTCQMLKQLVSLTLIITWTHIFYVSQKPFYAIYITQFSRMSFSVRWEALNLVQESKHMFAACSPVIPFPLYLCWPSYSIIIVFCLFWWMVLVLPQILSFCPPGSHQYYLWNKSNVRRIDSGLPCPFNQSRLLSSTPLSCR